MSKRILTPARKRYQLNWVNAYNRKHREIMQMYTQFLRLAFPERYLAISRKHQINHRDKCNARSRESVRRCREEYPHAHAIYSGLLRLAFPEKHHLPSIQRTKEWRKRNPERVKFLSKQWARNNPEKAKAVQIAGQIIRRTREKSAFVENCSQKILTLLQELHCHWCGDLLSNKTRCIDHVHPLARGGKHQPDNLVASCKSCNSSKGAKLVSEWRGRIAA